MITISGKEPAGLTQRVFLSRLKAILHEAITILRWEDLPLNAKIKVTIDHRLPVGSGRAGHEKKIKTLAFHPRPDKPYPWDTVRHELLHIILKKQIRVSFAATEKPLLTDPGYANQTTRENVEEYVVRVLNAIFLRKRKGRTWYRAQLIHEQRLGFKKMKKAARVVERWHKTAQPFTAQVLRDTKEVLLRK